MTSLSSEVPSQASFSLEQLFGRDDLDDIAVHRAIGRRLTESGLNMPVDHVLSDAGRGEAWALDLLHTVELPAPLKRLTMPVQELAGERANLGFESLWSRIVPGTRRHA